MTQTANIDLGRYAEQRLNHLKKWDKKAYAELINSPDLARWAEDFEDAVTDRIAELSNALEAQNAAIAEAQSRGDIRAAAGLIANDLETARQVVVREMVLTTPVDAVEDEDD